MQVDWVAWVIRRSRGRWSSFGSSRDAAMRTILGRNIGTEKRRNIIVNFLGGGGVLMKKIGILPPFNHCSIVGHLVRSNQKWTEGGKRLNYFCHCLIIIGHGLIILRHCLIITFSWLLRVVWISCFAVKALRPGMRRFMFMLLLTLLPIFMLLLLVLSWLLLLLLLLLFSLALLTMLAATVVATMPAVR